MTPLSLSDMHLEQGIKIAQLLYKLFELIWLEFGQSYAFLDQACLAAAYMSLCIYQSLVGA